MVIRLHKWTFRISLAFILGGVISASALVLPAFTGTPSISGTAVVGNTLSIIDTEATDADVGDIVTVSYQWFADEVPIIGAVNIDYTLTTLEAHASISAQVTANDNNDGSVAITTANVLVANSPPVISGIPLLTVDQDSSYSFTPVVSDLDGDTQSFSIVNQPAWADFDTATGTLSGSPTNADVGTTSGIIITSTDVELASDSLASFDLEVININDAPVINSVAITAASQDLAYSYSFFASDVDVADTLTYSTQTVLPTWLNFDDSTGVLSGTPSNADVGDHAVTLRVSDGTVNVDQSFTISVSNINDAPLINSVAITAATEDTAYSYTFSATDADLGDSLTYSATVLPAWLGFDDSTGVLSGTPLNADVGDHAVNLRVSDGTVNVDQSFTISVSNINDAPVISSASNTVATEDLAYSYTLTATDADTSDTLTYSAPLLPGWLTFEPDTGDLSGTPLNEHVGDHAVTLRVYDGTVNVEQSFIITVSNTNDVPVIDSVFIATAIQDLAYSYTFSASDVDALDTLIYSAFEIPTWLSFDDSTGVLSGTPVNADVGNHAVTLRVSDGAVIVEQSFTISVSNTNDAPVISSTAITTATEDIAYSYTFSAIDADLDALTYSAPVSPVWLVINPSTGELTGTPLNEHVGDHPVTLRVFDGTVNVEQSFTITVSNTNDAPVISGAPAITVEEDSFYTFTPVSSDVDVGDSDGLIFTIGNKPIWADFDSATGTLSGTPNNANVGTTNNILITVSDASLASATLPLFNLQVVNTNDAPTVTSSAVVLATEDSGYSYSFAAEDVDKDDTLIYSATSIPAWLGFNAVNGVLSGTPVNADVGAHAVTLSVSDGAVTVDQSFTITVSNTNDAPTISGSSVTFIDEDLAYSFTPVASDVDVGDVLTFSINNQPSWASFSTTTGTLSGTPTNADVGITNNIVITVTDAASATDSLPAFNLNVSNINDAPVISSVALTGVVQDTAYSYSVIASDEDVGDVLIYSAPTTPAWLNFDASTGVLSGTPSNADVGDHMVTLRVSDGTVNVDQSFTITVSNTNDAPVISSTEITTATEDTAYSYTLTATDADTSDTLTYSAPLLPDWLTFDPGTSVLSGTPLNTNVGEHAVTLRVFDGTVNVDQSFTITVSNTNDAPVISSVAITAATQDLAYSYSFSASDVDATDTLTYSVQTVLPTWLSFDDSTAVLSGTPLNADVGNHAVTLRVSDGTVNVDQSFTITVNNTNDAPVISSTSNNVATEDLAYSYTFSATDADLDALTYSAPLLPGWLDFDPGTGVLSGSPLNADVGDHTVTLRVTDGTVNVDQSFTITVSNTNDAPFIDSVAIISATQDQPYSYTFSASDVDVADTLTYSALAVLPTWLNFDASTGVLSGTPSNDDVGDHTVTLRVSDGSVNVDQGFSITVNNTNDAPVISSTAITTATEDAAYSYTFTATDADAGDTLIYTAPLLPGWLVFDSGTGILSGTPDNTHVGEHSITLRVFDGTVNVDQSFIVTVINSNDLPVITSTAILSATEEVAYSYLFSATDVDVSDVLTYSAPVSPTWLSIDATTGELSGIPANADVGSHAVTLRVNDGSVDIDQSFTITVSNTNDDPVISSVAPTSATEEVAYSYTFAASDEDVGDVLSYSVQTKPDWLSFNVSTGELTGTPSNADVGTYLVTLRVTDGVVNIDQSFLINVGNVNDAPVIISTAVTNVVEDTAYSYTMIATDDDVSDVLIYSAPVLPDWLNFDVSSAELTGLPANAEVGNHAVTLRVYDGTVNTEQTFTINVSNVNDAPSISGIPGTLVAESNPYSFTPLAVDIDQGDVLSFSIVNQPSWTSFSETTGMLTGTPSNADVGVTTGIVITVTDSSQASASLPAFDLNVSNTNNAPTIGGTPALSVVEDTAYSFTPVANDVDAGETLAFSISNAPVWADFDPATGTLSGTPDNSHVGTSNNIVITVTDGSSASDSLTAFNIEVINTNDAPDITSSANTQSVEDLNYSYNFTAIDIDAGDVLTYSAPLLPGWLSFDSASGVLSGTPNNSQLGDHSVTLRVSDGEIDVDQSFVITVSNTNDAPVITTTAISTALEDSLYSYTLLATDVDAGDILTYSAQSLPLWLNFDPSTAVLSGTPSNSDVGNHSVVLRVNDGTVNIDQSFTLTVINANDSPVISSTALITANEDSAYYYSFLATDVDTVDVLTYSATQIPAWLTFNPTTHILTGTPANTDVGDHAVILSVSDGTVTVDQNFIISVGNSNDAPLVSSTAVTAATEDDAYSYNFTATDVDVDDVLSYSVLILPAWLDFDTSTGLLSGMPGNADVGAHTVTLRVSDGIANADQTFVIVVSNVNDEPVVTSTAVITATEEMAYSYIFTAADVDVGDVLSYSAQTLPGWLSFNESTGLLSGMPTNADVGIHLVTLRVNDGSVNVDHSFNIIVSNANDAPTISGTPSSSAIEGQLYSFQPQAVDADVSDHLTFTIVNRPTWAEFNNSTGLLSGTPAAAHVGTTSGIVISVSDGTITAVLPAFNLMVSSDLNGDGVADIADLDGDGMDNAYELDVGFDPLDPADGLLDADGDGRTNAEEYSDGSNLFADDQPPTVIAPLDITTVATGFVTLVDFGDARADDALDGNLTASVDTDNHLQPGTHTITWSATDAAGNTGTDIQLIHVIPLVEFAIDQIGAEGNAVSVKVTLNGQAVSYPVEVPYTVSGTATVGDDHDLAAGTVVINSGTESLINFNIHNDGAGDAGETIIISMGTPVNAASGTQSEHTISIIEGNAAPQVNLMAEQQGITRIISQQNGMVVVSAEVSDANGSDTHTYDWSDSDNALIDTDQQDDSFSFDPTSVAPGLYTLTVTVSDGTESDATELSVIIMSSIPLLTTEDSDGDGIIDSEEGFGDSDNDGVPDYLDAISASNILQGLSGSSDQNIMETESGLSLALGLTAFQSLQGQAVISQDDIENFAAGPLDSVPNIGGIYDFVVSDLTAPGDSVRIVLPQLVSIPDNAGFRKLMPAGWQDFVIDDKNDLYSAAGESGYCPPPGDAAYTPGLTQGHWCVQLLIEDGGPNDADMIADQRVQDPGGLVQLSAITVSVESSGAAVYMLIWLLLAGKLLYFIEKNIRFRNES